MTAVLSRRRPPAEQAAPEADPAERAQGDVGEQAEPADQVELLEDEADAGAGLAHLAADPAVAPAPGSPKASITPSPASMVCRPVIERSRVDLPEPGRADQGDHLALADVQRHAVQRAALAEALGGLAGWTGRRRRTWTAELPRSDTRKRARSAPVPCRGFMARPPRMRSSASNCASAPVDRTLYIADSCPYLRAFRRTRCPEKRC